MKKTVRMKKTVFRYVSFALIVSILLLSPQVVRADTLFGTASGGITEAHSCNADVWYIAIPVSLPVDDHTYRIWFNESWWDNRSANSPAAVHYFNLNWTYDGVAGDSDYRDHTSYGGYAGSAESFYLDVDGIDPPFKLGVTWFASITVTSPYCFDSDSKVWGIDMV